MRRFANGMSSWSSLEYRGEHRQLMGQGRKITNDEYGFIVTSNAFVSQNSGDFDVSLFF